MKCDQFQTNNKYLANAEPIIKLRKTLVTCVGLAVLSFSPVSVFCCTGVRSASGTLVGFGPSVLSMATVDDSNSLVDGVSVVLCCDCFEVVPSMSGIMVTSRLGLVVLGTCVLVTSTSGLVVLGTCLLVAGRSGLVVLRMCVLVVERPDSDVFTVFAALVEDRLSFSVATICVKASVIGDLVAFIESLSDEAVVVMYSIVVASRVLNSGTLALVFTSTKGKSVAFLLIGVVVGLTVASPSASSIVVANAGSVCTSWVDSGRVVGTTVEYSVTYSGFSVV